MALKKHDFIKLNYTAMIKSGPVFDTTDAALAKKSGLGNGQFGPQTVCLGEGFLLKGLEDKIIGKDKGKYTIELKAEEAFGKKDPKMMRLFPTNKFVEQKVMPEPGVVVEMDGRMGTIKTVTGGRTTVDFNHPLAGKDITYDIEILDTVTDMTEKVKSIVTHVMEASEHVEVKDDVAKVGLHHSIPPAIIEHFKKKIMDLSGIKDITFDVHKH